MTLDDSGHGSEIRWREWSKEAFEEAKRENKIVLLDLTASWCHWCHVMDEKTYSSQEVADLVNRHFVPVRVDIDRRPDVSERYNRGGFPTTAFLSDRGESIWGTTYIPPHDMTRIATAILKAKESGEIDRALERDRAPYLHVDTPTERSREKIDRRDIDDAFEEVLSAYDVEHGGFGTEPKFPHPDALDLVLHRHALSEEASLAEVVHHTITSMAEGLYDPIEGGVFRYSVTRDWAVPHYEKMLETNTGFLRNVTRARGVIGEKMARELASGTIGYILRNLRDPSTGGLFGSQDAQEKYYRTDAKSRAGMVAPSVDRTVYAGWNCDAASALIEAGAAFGRQRWIDAGMAALEYALRELFEERTGLVRHTVGQELYLMEDQTSFLSAIVSALEVASDERLIAAGNRVAEAADGRFRMDSGGYGDRDRDREEVGEVQVPRRSLISNSRYARALALFGAITGRYELVEKGRNILGSFSPKELEAYGMFGSSLVLAWEAVHPGVASIELHTEGNEPWREDLYAEAKRAFDAGTVVKPIQDFRGRAKAWAVICTQGGCSGRIWDPNELRTVLGRRWTGQF